MAGDGDGDTAGHAAVAQRLAVVHHQDDVARQLHGDPLGMDARPVGGRPGSVSMPGTNTRAVFDASGRRASIEAREA
ncbi:hypothetical protein DLJ49_05365 [Rhodovulum sp. 12E13]|nr:hypothetical protein DLJ49_05365 [Rhodovulum sp. 12E13]